MLRFLNDSTYKRRLWLTWLLMLIGLLARQATAAKDCRFTVPGADIPIQTFIKNIDKSLEVQISTLTDPIIAQGTDCSAQPPNILAQVFVRKIDSELNFEEDIFFEELMSSTYKDGELAIKLSTLEMADYKTPNFAVYVQVQDAEDEKVQIQLCFGVYRYEDETLQENILMRQKDICHEVTCQIKFNLPVNRIVSPAIGSTATVDIATAENTIQSVGSICKYNLQFLNKWYVEVYAKFQDGSRVPDGYVKAVPKSFTNIYGEEQENLDFKYGEFPSWDYENDHWEFQRIIDMQVAISPQNPAQKEAVAVYVQVYDNFSNLATNWKCFMVNKDASDNSNFCEDYCSQYDQVLQQSSSLSENLAPSYFIELSMPFKQTYLNYGYRNQNPIGCPLTHEISSTNALAQSTLFVEKFSGVFYIQTQTDVTALGLEDQSIDFVMKVKNSAGQYVKNSLGTDEERSLKLQYTGCKSSAIQFSGTDTTFEFYVDSLPISQKNTFYIDKFSSTDPRCALSFTKISVNFVTDKTLDSIIQVDFKQQSKSDHYFNMTLTPSSLDPATLKDKKFTFDIRATDQNNDSQTKRFTVLILLCSTLQNCESCISTKLDATINKNVKQYTIGCSVCKNGYHGFLYLQGEYIIRGCQQKSDIAQEWSQANFGQLLIRNEDTNQYAVQDCSSIYANCQLCSGFGTCLQCNDGFQKSTFTQLAPVDLCMKNLNINNKKTQLFPNCQVSSETGKKDECLLCKPGYYAEMKKDFITQKQSIASCKLKSETPITKDYFVQSYNGQLSDDLEKIAAVQKFHQESSDGTTMNKPFLFLGDALSFLNSGIGLAQQHTNFTANVYLGKGDFHFFFCPVSVDKSACSAVNLPTKFALFKYPTLDTIQLNFKPLHCNQRAIWSSRTAAELTWFDNNCVPEATMPTVHVSKGFPMSAYFNITNSATFSNIKFSGLQQLQQPADSYSFQPQVICSVREEPSGIQKKLNVTSSNSFSQCDDVNFKGDYITAKECLTVNTRRPRPGKNEVYQDTYFQTDQTKNYYNDRQITLFNLYGFSSMHSTSTRVPTLTLTNCVFEYFFDYSSLIFVETYEYAFVQSGIFVKQARDRGFNIQMKDTTVRFSRFLKGTVFYKFDQIAKQGGLQLYQKNQKQMRFQFYEEQLLYPAAQLTDRQQLVIINCNFTLLNYGITENSLAIQSEFNYRQVTKHFQHMKPAVSFTTYQQTGAGIVLNLQGFQGTVNVQNSFFSKNMILFNPQISKTWEGLAKLGADLDDFKQTSSGQFVLQNCEEYIFSDVLTSYIDHPDQVLFQMEAMSPVLIQYSEKTVIFSKNVFQDNIGFMGGAMLIDSPNLAANEAYLASYPTLELRPVVILYENTFERNMAYSSGNAVYMRSTRTIKSKNVCGLVHLEMNTFTRNMAVTKSHNGGAITLTCDFVEKSASLSEFAGSIVPQTRLHIKDTLDPTIQYMTYQYGSGIVNNKFVENVSGQKGTAIYTRGINNLFVVQNQFVRNQPLYSFIEKEFESPLWKFYFQKNRFASFEPKIGSKLQLKSEFEYFQLKTKLDEQIELPQVKGTIYIEMCEVCLVSYIDFDCNECRKHMFTYNEVTNNTFTDNQAGIIFQEDQTLLKSSQLQIFGGNEYNIESNNFSNIGSIYQSRMQQEVPDFANNLPPKYFQFQSTPLIRVTIPDSTSGSSSNLNFRYNLFQNITGHQSFTGSNLFTGFLIQGLQDYGLGFGSQVVFEGNQVRYCSVYGIGVSLFSFSSSVTARYNQFYKIGGLTKNNFVPPTKENKIPHHPSQLDEKFDLSFKSIFNLTSPNLVRTQYENPIRFEFTANDFKAIFCTRACIYDFYSSDDSHPSVQIFESNYYRHILAQRIAIGKTKAFVTKRPEQIQKYTYIVQIFNKEFYEDVQNDLYQMLGNQNKVVQIFKEVKSINNFGSDTLIYSEDTDAIFMQDSVFTHTTAHQQRFQALDQILSLTTNDMLNNDALLDLYFNGTFFDDKIRKEILSIGQNDGVMQIVNNQILIKNESDFNYLKYVFYNNDTVWNFIKGQYDSKEITSSFKGNTFSGHRGKTVSLFNLQNSRLTMKDSKFRNNTATLQESSTFLVQSSQLNGTNLDFRENKSIYGVLRLVESRINFQNPKFLSNSAQRAGVIFSDKSFLTLEGALFRENSAYETSTLHLYGWSQTPLIIRNSDFIKNQGNTLLIKVESSSLKIENSTFTDNRSTGNMNGIMFDTSEFIANNITVSNSYKNASSPAISGFMFLKSQSSVRILNSNFSNLQGAQAAAILVEGQSKAYIEKSTFQNNTVNNYGNKGGQGTIVAIQSLLVTVVDCNFTRNHNTNLLIDKTPLVVTGSRFNDKNTTYDESFIESRGQSVQVSNSYFQISNSSNTLGSGIYGDALPSLEINGCVFQQLYSYQGAIFLKSSRNADLSSNIFQSNSATQGGAIYLQQSEAQIRSNLFYENSVKALSEANIATGLAEGAGGAIYFTCVDQKGFENFFNQSDTVAQSSCNIVLKGNKFQNNTATNKGGALFTANKNVTFQGENDNLFVDNLAPQGDVFASQPSHMAQSFEWTANFQNNDGGQNFTSRSLLGGQNPNLYISSGTRVNLNLTIVDASGSQYYDDSNSISQIEFETTMFSNIIIGGEAIANKGLFEFSNVEFRIKPGTEALIQVRVQGLSNYGNDIPFIERPIQFKVYSRPCKAGEVLTAQETCKECESGTYLLAASTEMGQCYPCFLNVMCHGGRLVSPNQGYFRIDILTEAVEKCPNFEACLGGNQDKNMFGKCAQGYEGALCGQCQEGYYQRIDAFVCYSCFSIWWEVIIWILSIAVCIGIIYWIQKQYMRNFEAANNITLTIFKIMVTNMQMIMMLSKIGDFGDSRVEEIFLSLKLIILELFLRIICPECLLKSIDRETIFYIQVSLMTLLPLIIFVGSFLLWNIYYRKAEGRSLKSLNSAKWTASMILFIYYPFILESLLTSVSCQPSQEINWDPLSTQKSPQVQRLRVRPEILCFQGTHSWFIWAVSIPAIIMWIVVLPILLLKYLHTDERKIVKNYQHLNHVQDEKAKPTSGEEETIYAQAVKETKSRYSFFFIGFKLVVPTEESEETQKRNQTKLQKLTKSVTNVMGAIFGRGLLVWRPNSNQNQAHSFYYWELIVYMRKILLCVLVILGRSLEQQIQLTLILVFFAAFTVIQIMVRPYIEKQANRLELFSLIVGLTMVYLKMEMISQAQLKKYEQKTYNMFSGQQFEEDGSDLKVEFKNLSTSETDYFSVISKIVIFSLILSFDFICAQQLRHQLLIFLSELKYEKSFKTLTLFQVDMKEFRDRYGRWRAENQENEAGQASQSSLPAVKSSQSDDEQESPRQRYQANLFSETAQGIEEEEKIPNDSARKLIDDSYDARPVGLSQIGLKRKNQFDFNLSRKGVHPINLQRPKSDRSMNRPFNEPRQSQNPGEARRYNRQAEVGGTVEKYSLSKSQYEGEENPHPVGEDSQSNLVRVADGDSSGIDILGQESEPTSRREDLSIPAQRPGRNARVSKSLRQDQLIDSSSGEFEWEDQSVSRDNNNEIMYQRSKPAPTVQLSSDLASEFWLASKRQRQSSLESQSRGSDTP